MHRVLTLMIGSTAEAAIRTETLSGREYTVVPVIAIVEGVLQGANSVEAEFAAASEFGKYPDSWNGRPVVLRHPQINGVFVSANNPLVLEDYHMGFMFNTRLDGKKLKTEAWLDNALIAEKGADFQETLDRILAGEVLENSVGAFIDTRARTGTYNGKQYAAAWENVVPDHLAILPDEKGACSIADGCGTNRVASAAALVATGATAARQASDAVAIHAFSAAHPEIRLVGPTPCCDSCAEGDGCVSNNSAGETPGTPAAPGTPGVPMTPDDPGPPQQQPPVTPGHGQPANEPGPLPAAATHAAPEQGAHSPEAAAHEALRTEQRGAALQELVVNALGDQVDVGDARRLVAEALPDRLGVERYMVDLLAMTVDSAVFYTYGEPNLRGFHQIGYSVSNEGAVTFTGDPEPVNLMTKIMPRQTSPSANASGSTNSEEDGAMSGNAGTGSETPATAGEQNANGTGAPAPATPAVAAAAPTLNEFLQTVPAELRGVLAEGIQMREQRKTTLVGAIKANSRNKFSEEQLNGFDLPVLENLAALADVPSYQGRVPGHEQSESLTVNGQGPSAFAEANPTYLSATPPAGNA